MLNKAPILVGSITCFTSLGKEGFLSKSSIPKRLIPLSFCKPSRTLLSANRVSVLVNIGLESISSCLANRVLQQMLSFCLQYCNEKVDGDVAGNTKKD